MGRPPSGRCNIFLPRLTDWSFWLLKMAVKYTLKAPVAAPCPMFFPLTPSPQCCGWSSTRHSTRQTCLQPFFFLTAHTQRLLLSPKPELFALMVRDGKQRSIKNNYLRQKKKRQAKKNQAPRKKHSRLSDWWQEHRTGQPNGPGPSLRQPRRQSCPTCPSTARSVHPLGFRFASAHRSGWLWPWQACPRRPARPSPSRGAPRRHLKIRAATKTVAVAETLFPNRVRKFIKW